MILWQLLHGSTLRCSSIFSRSEGSFVLPEASSIFGLSGGTPGGGSGGLMPRRFDRIHLPRTTALVRSGFDVVVRRAALPNRPHRFSSAGPSVTRRN